MIPQFHRLTEEEQELLYKVPILISVLASCFCENQKRPNAEAIRLAYLKTFVVHPLLLPYYHEIEMRFIGLFQTAIKQYFPFVDPMRITLNREMDRANRAISKLDREYAQTLHQSLEKYASHVKSASDTVCSNLSFPAAIPVLAD
jgi:hypothetical protein